MIRQAGYPAEAHVIETKDGYLLTLHRIPGKKGERPVLLQHGLLCSSADWVIPGKDKGLGILMLKNLLCFYRKNAEINSQILIENVLRRFLNTNSNAFS